MKLSIALLATVLLGFAPGCEKLECQPGTLQDGNTCVASQEARCPDDAELDGNGKCVLKSGGGLKCGAGTHDNGGECVSNALVDGNASRIYSMTLQAPTEIVSLANPILNNDFASGASLVFMGATAIGPELRIWGGLDDRGTALNVVVTSSGYNVAATRTNDIFEANVAVFPIQILGADTAVLKTKVTNGVLDSSGSLTQVKSFHFEGILTAENAELVYIEQAGLSLKDFILSVQPYDADADDDGTKDGWFFKGDVVTELTWVYER